MNYHEVYLLVIAILAIVIVALLYVIQKQSKGLEVSFPPALVGLIRPGVSLLQGYAGKTGTKLDDAAVETALGVLNDLLKTQGQPPVELPTTTATNTYPARTSATLYDKRE